MTSDPDTDATLRELVDCFRNRLKSLIQVEPVLDHINFIEREQKDLILHRAKTDGNPRAADLLIDTVIRNPHPPGWCRDFLNALEAGGCKHAAQYVDTEDLPSPSLEANNDYAVQLVDLLAPSLIHMKTGDVCFFCFTEGILTAEDQDHVSNVTVTVATSLLRIDEISYKVGYIS